MTHDRLRHHSKVNITVIMAAYNAERFIVEAISSIRRQTFGDFEFIITNDGSTDSTLDVLTGEAERDPRIVILSNEKNRGLAYSLNRGIDIANGKYIARMDADDVAKRNRLERQFSCLEQDEQLVIVGSNAMHVSQNMRSLFPTFLPESDWDIRCACLVVNPFVHSAVMIRRSVLIDKGLRYDGTYLATQDWDLWEKLLESGSARNLPECLIQLRKHDRSISSVRIRDQTENGLRVQERYVKKILGEEIWDKQRFQQLYTGFLGVPNVRARQRSELMSSCQQALDILDQVKDKYPHQRSIWLSSFVLGRCIWSGVLLIGQTGWKRFVERLLRNYYKELPFGAFWLYSVFIAVAMARLRMYLR